MEAFGKISLFTILLFLSTLLGAYIFSCMWSWFIVTTFNTIELSVIQAMGIIITVRFVTSQSTKNESNKKFDELLKDFFVAIVAILIVFFFAWLIHLAM